jgi:hypothetical protein
MSQSTDSKNKALVLRAFDTLFNKRDYPAAERFWSSNYIQHSAHIEPGREGLFNLIKGAPASLNYEPGVDEKEAGNDERIAEQEPALVSAEPLLKAGRRHRQRILSN